MAKIITSKNRFVLLYTSDLYNDIQNLNIVNAGNSQTVFSIVVTSKTNITTTNPPPMTDYYEFGRTISAGGRITTAVPVDTGESIWVYSDSSTIVVRADSKFVLNSPSGTVYADSNATVQW